MSIEGLSRIAHPLEGFVATTLDRLYSNSLVVVQPDLISNRKGRTQSDLAYSLLGYPKLVYIEVTQSPMCRQEPKHRQERVLCVASREQDHVESAILYKQHFASPEVVRLSLAIIHGLAAGEIRTSYARDQLKYVLGHARCRENMTHFDITPQYLTRLGKLVG